MPQPRCGKVLRFEKDDDAGTSGWTVITTMMEVPSSVPLLPGKRKRRGGYCTLAKKNRVPIPPWRQRPVFRPQRKPRRRERHFHHCIVVVVRSVRSLDSEEAKKRRVGEGGGWVMGSKSSICSPRKRRCKWWRMAAGWRYGFEGGGSRQDATGGTPW